MSIGERIRAERLRVNLTQKELGEKISVTKNAISMYETGRRTPDLVILRAMADLFQISLDRLTANDDPIQSISTDQAPSKPGSAMDDTAVFQILEQELLSSFRLLNYENRFIIVGEAKKALRDQQRKK